MTNKDSNHTQDASVNKKSAAEDKSAAANKALRQIRAI